MASKMKYDDLKSQLLGNYTPYEAQTDEQLRTQLEGIYKPQYEQQLTGLRNNLTTQLGQQDRRALNTGMQRSSWNRAAKAGMRNDMLSAQSSLATQYEGNMTQQLQNLRNAEYNKKLQSDQYRDSLMLQLYALQ